MFPVLVLAACTTAVEQASIWPPADFEVVVEEVSLRDDRALTERRFRVRANGIVVYGRATGAVEDPTTGTTLPVFGKLAIYELVPSCTRALARRLYRAGVLELDAAQGEAAGQVSVGTLVKWRAFDKRVALTSRGRVHGAMADILAIVGAHLPEGEQFTTPGVDQRGLQSVLRGVPELRDDGSGALQACLELLRSAGEDETVLLDAFALACYQDRREVAMELLARWRRAVEAARAREAADGAAAADEAFSAEVLARMLPAAGS